MKALLHGFALTLILAAGACGGATTSSTGTGGSGAGTGGMDTGGTLSSSGGAAGSTSTGSMIDPCAGKACGDFCCASPECEAPGTCDDMGLCNIGEPPVCCTAKACGSACTKNGGAGLCTPEGLCVATAVVCPGYDPCANKVCGDACSSCDPADPTCSPAMNATCVVDATCSIFPGCP